MDAIIILFIILIGVINLSFDTWYNYMAAGFNFGLATAMRMIFSLIRWE